MTYMAFAENTDFVKNEAENQKFASSFLKLNTSEGHMVTSILHGGLLPKYTTGKLAALYEKLAKGETSKELAAMMPDIAKRHAISVLEFYQNEKKMADRMDNAILVCDTLVRKNEDFLDQMLRRKIDVLGIKS